MLTDRSTQPQALGHAFMYDFEIIKKKKSQCKTDCQGQSFSSGYDYLNFDDPRKFCTITQARSKCFHFLYKKTSHFFMTDFIIK